MLADTAAQIRENAKRGGNEHRNEFGPAKRERSRSRAREVVKTSRHRVGLPVELKRRVVRDHRVVGEGCRDEVWIHWNRLRIGASRNDGVETSPHSDKSPPRRRASGAGCCSYWGFAR